MDTPVDAEALVLQVVLRTAEIACIVVDQRFVLCSGFSGSRVT